MNNLLENYRMLKEYAFAEGASLFGAADITHKKEHIKIYPPSVLENLNCAVSIGLHLSDSVLETIIDRPNKLYSRHYKMANMFLDQIALKIGERIQRSGYNYIPIPASQMLDWEDNTSHASHRAIAYYAGLGWRGRSSLLINPRYGARVRYVSILTDMPMTFDKPLERDCGNCLSCLKACPAGAIHQDHYDIDACTQLLKHYAKTLHVSLICGVCVKACRGKEMSSGGDH